MRERMLLCSLALAIGVAAFNPEAVKSNPMIQTPASPIPDPTLSPMPTGTGMALRMEAN